MKLLNWIWKGSIGTFRVLYLLLAVAIILVAAYALGGYDFLGGRAWGTDLTSALSMAAWVDKYFPRVPFWYPLAGGGVSLTHSYPVFSFYLVSALKRITDLNLIQAFRVLGFASVPLMALGIYAFVALRFKNQTAALIASILYLISPIAWVWLFDWGFYAEAVSHTFVMPAIIFWDLFFTSFLNDTAKTRNRVYLILTAIFLSLATLVHFGTGLGLMGFFAFYILGYCIKEKERRKVFVRGILALSLVGALTLLATAFVALPFYRYSKVAAQAGLGRGRSYEQIKGSALSVSHVLSFQTAVTELGHPLATRHISFPTVVSFFAVLGVLISLQSAGFLTLALFAIFAILLTTSGDFMFWALRHIPWPLHAPFTWRLPFIPLRMVLPALAALGAIGIFKLPFFWVRGRITGFIKGAFASLAGLALVVFTLYQFGYLPKPEHLPFNYGARGIDLRNIWSKEHCLANDLEGCIDVGGDQCLLENARLYFGNEEGLKAFDEGGDKEWCHSPLRPYFLPVVVRVWCSTKAAELRVEGIGGEKLPELCHLDRLTDKKVKSFWQRCKEDEGFSELCALRFWSLEEQLLPSGWPELKIADSLADPTASPTIGWPGQLKQFEAILNRIAGENSSARMDFSPYVSDLAMRAPYYNLDRGLSQIYIYAADSSLIRRFWGQQISAFYLDDPSYGKDPNFINNWTRWFGLNYLFFESHTDEKLLKEAGWESWGSIRDEEGTVKKRVLEFSEENSLADLSEKPAVLVIAQRKVNAYDQVFRLASYGMLPYKDAFVVWGKGVVDSYSLEELQSFDVLVLHGYTYKSWGKANSLLSNYVRGGGKVFIDTGWQFNNPDWETENALEIIPFNKLSWKDLGKISDFVLESDEFGSGVDVSKFAPLIYEDQPWSVSTGERSDLRDWAKVVLSVKDYPLVIIGELGEGKVVWSGMNIFSHAKQKEGPLYEEVEFLTNLFSWLTEGATVDNFAVTYTRDHPDRVEFTIEEDVPDGGFLLWKEAYHPDFHAMLVTSDQRSATRLRTYRSGPSLVLIKVPELEIGDKIVYEYRKPLVEKASTWISLLTILLLPALVVEGAFTKEKSLFLRLVQTLEGKLHYLFFELRKKPLEWWGKDEEEG